MGWLGRESSLQNTHEEALVVALHVPRAES
jgi:hypothetical protein